MAIPLAGGEAVDGGHAGRRELLDLVGIRE